MTPKPIYILHGSDAFLRESHRKRIVHDLIGQGDPQLCLSILDSGDDLANVLDEVRTLPFLAPRRVVVVRDAEAFVSDHRAALETFLDSPPDSGSLILEVLSWDARTKLSKKVAQVGELIDCSCPDVRELPPWIKRTAESMGKKIAPAASAMLAEWVGADLAALQSELQKLSSFVGQRAEITAADVSAVVIATAGPGAFDLTNALTAGDARAALKALAGMLTVRGEEFRILGLVRTHLLRLLKGHQAAASGGRPEQVLPFNIPPKAKNEFLTCLKRRNARKLQDDFRRLLRCDLAMKSGNDAAGAMQELIVGLCK